MSRLDQIGLKSLLGLRLQLLFFEHFGFFRLDFGKLRLQIGLRLLGGLLGLAFCSMRLQGLYGSAAVVTHEQGIGNVGVAGGLQCKLGKCWQQTR